MCLILIKDSNTKLNSTFFEYCEKAAISNSHGIGFAMKRANKDFIFIQKGFKKPADLIYALEELVIKEKDELIIHFRMATFGSQGKANCHPFLISDVEKNYDNNEQMILGNTSEPTIHQVHLNHPIAFMHNGCMWDYEKVYDNDKDFSDTRNFAKRFLNVSIKDKSIAANFYELKKSVYPIKEDFEKAFKETFTSIKGQKFAFLSAKYGILTIGDFIKDSHGFYHSNSSAMYKNRMSY